jgi:glycosyltransferase involved in cell wall biosynthesis
VSNDVIMDCHAQPLVRQNGARDRSHGLHRESFGGSPTSADGQQLLANTAVMRVAQISPTFFDESSVIGGGERYALELSRSLAPQTATTLITFSKRSDRPTVESEGNLEIRHYPASRFVGGNLANPFAVTFLKDLRSFDLLHCFGYPTAVTDLCILFAKMSRKKLFITDVHGGGICVSTYLSKLGIDTRRLIDGFLLLSAHNARAYRSQRGLVRVIGGGVDTDHFRPLDVVRERKVLFVGRLIPVKGVNYLIQAVDPETRLRIVGPQYDEGYFGDLRMMARGKCVEFSSTVSDGDLAREYASALVTVVPSVYTDLYGRPTPGELFGLVALESMACGTPVIATHCGGLPEVVEDGVTGFLVPPNDPLSIREKIRFILDRPNMAKAMGEAGRQRVLRDFTWAAVAERCRTAYREAFES